MPPLILKSVVELCGLVIGSQYPLGFGLKTSNQYFEVTSKEFIHVIGLHTSIKVVNYKKEF